ncbi:MAG: hypothetical protein R6V12_19395, partial [Candidatus Hydrogenedentota bacterium]
STEAYEERCPFHQGQEKWVLKSQGRHPKQPGYNRESSGGILVAEFKREAGTRSLLDVPDG